MSRFAAYMFFLARDSSSSLSSSFTRHFRRNIFILNKFNSMVGKVDLQEATRLIGEDTSVFNRSSFAKFSLITWSTTFCFLNLCSELSAGYYFRLMNNFGGTELITVTFCPYTRKI